MHSSSKLRLKRKHTFRVKMSDEQRKSERRQPQPIINQTMKIRFSVKLNITHCYH